MKPPGKAGGFGRPLGLPARKNDDRGAGKENLFIQGKVMGETETDLTGMTIPQE